MGQGHLELSAHAGGPIGVLAAAAVTATLAVEADGVGMTAQGTVIQTGSSVATTTLLTYSDRLLTMPTSDLLALAFEVQQFMVAMITAWREEFLTAGALVLPLLLILVARRMRD
jgi:hypothetical protein